MSSRASPAGCRSTLAKRSRQSASWVQGTATVLATDVIKRTDAGSSSGSSAGFRTTYDPHIKYAYDVGGQSYENDTYALAAQTAIPTSAGVEAILKGYPIGLQVPVFFDPANPGDSALIRGGSEGARISLCSDSC